jgi:hypothetical protein
MPTRSQLNVFESARARWSTALVIVSVALLSASGVRADETKGDAGKVTVRAVVTNTCSTDVGAARVNADGSVDAESTQAAVATRCGQGVEARTLVSYETVAVSSTESAKNLVVTVLF